MTSRHRTVPPRDRATAGWVAGLLALLILALGVVTVLDVVLAQRDARDPWSRGLLSSLDGLEPSTVTTAAGVVVFVLGILVVLSALKPRRRTHLEVQSRADLWLTPQAVGALAARVAERDPEVLNARVSRAGRRRVVVGVSPRDPEATGLAERVQGTVRDRLAPVGGVAVEVRQEEDA